MCTSKNLIGTLTNKEESEFITLLRKNPELKITLSLGVVMAGKETEAVTIMLEGKQVSAALLSVLQSEKNSIKFNCLHMSILYRSKNLALPSSTQGAEASAFIYSVAATTCANGLNVDEYFQIERQRIILAKIT